MARLFTVAGTDRLNWGSDAKLDNLAQGAFTAWAVIRRTADAPNQGILGKGSSIFANGWAFILEQYAGEGHLRLILGRSGGQTDIRTTAGVTPLNTHCFVAAVHDGGGGVTLYASAFDTPVVQVTAQTDAFGSGTFDADAGTDLWAGNSEAAGGSIEFGGDIDWTGVHTGALTRAQLRQIQQGCLAYNAGKTTRGAAMMTSITGCVLAGKLNSGGTATDLSASPATGTFTGTDAGTELPNVYAFDPADFGDDLWQYATATDSLLDRTSYLQTSGYARTGLLTTTAASGTLWMMRTLRPDEGDQATVGLKVDGAYTDSLTTATIGELSADTFSGLGGASKTLEFISGPRSRPSTLPAEGTWPTVVILDQSATQAAPVEGTSRLHYVSESTLEGFFCLPAQQYAPAITFRDNLPNGFDGIASFATGGCRVAWIAGDTTLRAETAAVLTAGNPAAVVIAIGVNDKVNNTVLSTFSTQLTALVQEILDTVGFTGNIYLLAPLITVNYEGTNANGDTLDDFRDETLAIATGFASARVIGQSMKEWVTTGQLDADGTHLTNTSGPIVGQRLATTVAVFAEIIVTVGPTGRDYTSLSAAEAGEQAVRSDLAARNEQLSFVCDGFEDTVAVTLDGWTPSPTNYIVVRPATGAEAQSPWTTSGYRLVTPSTCVTINESYTRLQNIQLEVNGDDFGLGGINFFGTASIEISGCHIRALLSGATSARGRAIYGSDHTGTSRIFNNFVNWQMSTTDGVEQTGILLQTFTGNAVVYNNTVIGNASHAAGIGIEDGYAAILAKNNLVSGFTTCFSSMTAGQCANNASSDTTAPGTGARISQTFTFVDAAGGDYRLASTDTGARTFGADLSADATYPLSTAFNDTLRLTPWDIGAHETGVVDFVSQVASISGDYSSLSAWEAGEQATYSDLVAAKARVIAECQAFVDTTAVVVDGWTTSTTRYPVIRAAAGAEAQLPYSASAYRLEVTNPGNNGVLGVSENNVRIERIQIQHTLTADIGRAGIAFRYQDGAGELRVDGCVIRGVISGTTNCSGIRYVNVPATMYVTNTVVLDYPTTTFYAFESGGGGPAYYYNCTAFNCRNGFLGYSNISTKNCLFDGQGTGGSGFASGSGWLAGTGYNASTDATAPGTNSRQSQTFTFRDATAGDFRLDLEDAGARRFGVDLSADSVMPFATDFAGKLRHSAAWDIGAHQSAQVVISQVAASGGDYTSLSAWEAGEQAVQADLVAVNEVSVAECQAFEDTASAELNGQTTSDENYLVVRAAAGAEAQMPWSTSAYRLSGGGVLSLEVYSNYTRIERLQIEHTNGLALGGFKSHGIDVRMDGCVVRSTAVTGSSHGIEQSASSASLLLRNTFVYGWMGMGVTLGSFADGALDIYNCTIVGNGSYGINRTGNDTNNICVVKNTLCHGNGGNDFNGSFSAGTNYNASSDATAPGTSSRLSQTFTFVNAAAGDLHLASADTGAAGYGTDLSADPIYPFTTDFDGDTRTLWSIGADDGTAATGDSQTVNHTPGTADITIGAVFVVSTDVTPDISATFDAEVMTSAGIESDSGNDYHLEVFYISEPAAPQQVFEGSTNAGLVKGLSIVSYDEVPLVDPIRSTVLVSGNSTTPGGTLPTVELTDRAVAFLSWVGTATLTVDTAGGETLVSQSNDGDHNIAVIEKEGAAGTVAFAPDLSAANPWQLVATAVKGTGVGNYQVTAESGTVTLAGQDAALERGALVAAEAAAVALAGTDASLELGTLVTAEAGTIALTGTDAGLVFDRTVSAEVGTVALTGTDAGLILDRAVAADAGAVVITGTDAALGTEATLSAEAGAVALTGTEASLVVGHAVVAEAGAVTITGQDSTLGFAREVAAEAGSVAVAGQDAQFNITHVLAADPGAVVITGMDATIGTEAALSADPGSVALTGTDAALVRGLVVAGEAGALAIAGQDSQLLVDRPLVAESGAVVVSGTDATLQVERAVSAEAGEVVLAGQDVTLGFAREVAAEAGAVATTGQDSQLLLARRVAAEAAAVAITGTDAALGTEATLSAETGAVALNGTDAALVVDRTAVAEAGAVAITGQDSTLVRARVTVAEEGAVALTGQEAALLQGRAVQAEAGAVTVAGQDAQFPRIYQVNAEAGAIVLTGQEAILSSQPTINAESGSIALTGTDVTLAREYVVTAEAGEVSATGTAANLEKGSRVAADAGAMTATGQEAQLLAGPAAQAEAGTVALAGTDAALRKTSVVVAEIGQVTITGQDAGLGTTLDLQAESGNVQLTGQDATFSRLYRLLADPGTVDATGTDAGTITARVIPLEPTSYDITGYDVYLGPQLEFIIEADSGDYVLDFSDATLYRTAYTTVPTGRLEVREVTTIDGYCIIEGAQRLVLAENERNTLSVVNGTLILPEDGLVLTLSNPPAVAPIPLYGKHLVISG